MEAQIARQIEEYNKRRARLRGRDVPPRFAYALYVEAAPEVGRIGNL